MREEWRVVDRWWTEEPVSRRYFDVVLETGQNAVVFRDEEPAAGSASERERVTRREDSQPRRALRHDDPLLARRRLADGSKRCAPSNASARRAQPDRAA